MALPHRRIGFAIGGAAAAVAGALIAWGLVNSHRGEPAAPPPASVGGLVIDSSGAKAGRIDAARPLRCFVAGRLVGELSLADCARRNGVATEALDVGSDQTGALAAGEKAGPAITPLPPIAPQAAPSAPPAPAAANVPPIGACWRYGDGQWRKLPSDTTLNGCVQALFAGRCEPPGGATYGRWMQQTLRLAPGRVEISADNHSFRTLVEQGPGCAIPAAGG